MALPADLNLGTAPDNGTGDDLNTGGQKIKTNLEYLDANKEDKANKGAANGYAPLDANTKVPEEYIPFDSVLAQKVQVSTGWLQGLTLSINATDPATFDIAPGKGFYTDNSDPLNPITVEVDYPGSTGNAVTNILNWEATYIALQPTVVGGIVTNISVIQLGSTFSNENGRDYITIGSLIHTQHTQIEFINSIANTVISPTSQLHDLIRLFGTINDQGNKILPNGANLQLNKTAGIIFKLGLNPGTKNPHERAMAERLAFTFRYRLRDGTEYADVSAVNPNQWDNNGVLSNVASNNYTIQMVALFQSNEIRIQPGQTQYASLDAAAAALPTSNFTYEQNIAENGIILAHIIVKEGTVSLQNAANCKIVPTNKFGEISGGAGAGITNASVLAAIGYTPENVANKAIDFSVINNTLYPTVQATENRYATQDLANLASDLTGAEKKGILDKVLSTDSSLYIDANGQIRANVSTYAQELTWLTGQSQTIILDFEPTNFVSIEVNGQGLMYSQWNFTAPTSVLFNDLLDNNDKIRIVYERFIIQP